MTVTDHSFQQQMPGGDTKNRWEQPEPRTSEQSRLCELQEDTDHVQRPLPTTMGLPQLPLAQDAILGRNSVRGENTHDRGLSS